MPILYKICLILVGMYLLCLRSPRCDFELIFIVYLVGDVAARHPSPRVHQLGDPSNSIWSYSRNYNQTRYAVINMKQSICFDYLLLVHYRGRIKNKNWSVAGTGCFTPDNTELCSNSFGEKVVASTLFLPGGVT